MKPYEILLNKEEKNVMLKASQRITAKTIASAKSYLRILQEPTAYIPARNIQDKKIVDIVAEYVYRKRLLGDSYGGERQEYINALLALKAGIPKETVRRYVSFNKAIKGSSCKAGSLKKRVVKLLGSKVHILPKEYGCYTQYRVNQKGSIESYFNSPTGYNPIGWSNVGKWSLEELRELYIDLLKTKQNTQ